MRQLFKIDDRHDFRPILAEIEDSPVSPLGRAVFWLIVTTIIFFTLWTCLGEIDVVVSSVTAKVIPDGQVKMLQPLETGVISKICVKEGEYVKKNQVLMEIDPSSVQPEIDSLRQNLRYTEIEGQRLKASVNGHTFNPSAQGGDSAALATQKQLFVASRASLGNQLTAKQEELKKVEAQISATLAEQSEKQKLLSVSKVKEQRMRSVLDIVAREEYEKVTNEIVSYENDIRQAECRLGELDHAQREIHQEIQHIQEEFRTSNLRELADREKQSADLSSKLQQSIFKGAQQLIVSPVDGYVDTIFFHTVGGVVPTAQNLISIVPVNTPLVIKATIPSRDVGFVEEKMPVAIKVDTFEFQKYGMFDGKVKLVSHDSREDEKLGTVYDIYVTPLTSHIMVEGEPRKLSPGMSVVAEVKVGKRRIIEFFVYPLVKHMHDGLSVR